MERLEAAHIDADRQISQAKFGLKIDSIDTRKQNHLVLSPSEKAVEGPWMLRSLQTEVCKQSGGAGKKGKPPFFGSVVS